MWVVVVIVVLTGVHGVVSEQPEGVIFLQHDYPRVVLALDFDPIRTELSRHAYAVYHYRDDPEGKLLSYSLAKLGKCCALVLEGVDRISGWIIPLLGLARSENQAGKHIPVTRGTHSSAEALGSVEHKTKEVNAGATHEQVLIDCDQMFGFAMRHRIVDVTKLRDYHAIDYHLEFLVFVQTRPVRVGSLEYSQSTRKASQNWYHQTQSQPSRSKVAVVAIVAVALIRIH